MQGKNILSIFIGIVGATITTLFGGWSVGLTTLVIFMTVDYISGLLVAGVFKASPKSKSGALSSKVGYKGLCKKGMSLLIVLIAYRLDLLVGTNYIRDAVVIGFCVNELISIVENAGLMGIPLPPILIKTIDVLVNREEKLNE